MALGLSLGLGLGARSGTSLAAQVAAIFSSGVDGWWHDPTFGPSLWGDVAATNLAGVGSEVLRVDDRSGNGWNLTLSDPTKAPILGSTYIDFEETDYLQLTTAAVGNGATPIEIYAAIETRNSGSFPCFINPIGGANGLFLYAPSGGSPLRGVLNGGTGGAVQIDSTKGNVVVNRRHVIGLRYDGATFAITCDGTEVGANTRSGTFGSPTEYRVGHLGSVGNAWRHYGMICVRGSISEQDRHAITKYLAQSSNAWSAIALGDSTVSAYFGGSSLMALTGSQWQQSSLAMFAHTIAQQKAAFLGQSNGPLAKWTVIQVGLNDMNPTEAASEAIARLQDLVDTVRARNGAEHKLIVSQMIPCRQRWIDIYGGNGATAQAKWAAINEAIAGGGATPISNVDGRVTSHVALMDDGAGNLRAEYDTGDHVHPNEAGRIVNAAAWVEVISAVAGGV